MGHKNDKVLFLMIGTLPFDAIKQGCFGNEPSKFPKSDMCG